ncbi:murein transglycosylase A [Algihabitans sp.]|uniref:murein transglycosylase A n=1 Tax=Algihabitans sp. TaxID=2821514 RepID=UPI003BACA48B
MPFPRSIALLLSGLALALTLGGCTDNDVEEQAEAPPEAPPEAPSGALPEAPPVLFEPVDFADLPGWTDDAHAEALPAMQRSCERLLRRDDDLAVGPGGLAGTVADWRGPCEALILVDAGYAATFFEEWFRPFAVSAPGDDTPDEGLFTGYYEAELAASEQSGDGYNYPILALPDDLVTVRLQDFRADLPPERLVGRVEDNRLVPYYDRAAIETGRLEGLAEPLLWAKDPVDLHILQIQGSGRASLPDGSRLRIGFAGSNGLPFVGIGRVMLDRGLVEPGKGSMQHLRAWLKANPEAATDIMRENPRYIFFRRIEGEGPIGALGVPLTPERSLAIDPRLLPLGAPIWLSTTRPGPDETPLRRLMVAQDTGSAIVGAVRGDFYWGTGEAALDEAGRMAERGRYWLLLPRTVAERREVTG